MMLLGGLGIASLIAGCALVAGIDAPNARATDAASGDASADVADRTDAGADMIDAAGTGCVVEDFDRGTAGVLTTIGDGGITYPSTGCHSGARCAEIVGSPSPEGFRFDFSPPVPSGGVAVWVYPITWDQAEASITLRLLCSNGNDYAVDLWSSAMGYYFVDGGNAGSFNHGDAGLPVGAWTDLHLLLDGAGTIRFVERGIDAFDLPATAVNCGGGVQAVEVTVATVAGYSMDVRLDTFRAGPPGCL